MKQFQVGKSDLNETRFVEIGESDLALSEGEIIVSVDCFGYSANNITYGVMGERLSYWQFFPPLDDKNEQWGIIPVWGFGDVVASKHADIPVGDRLFGYLPSASRFVMRPAGVSEDILFDASEHRLQLPKGYNLYRRVLAESDYDKAGDALRMLLYPLYITGFCIWDQLSENNWYGSEQVVIASASSKTSIGTAYALKTDKGAPKLVGLTSSNNLEFIKGLGLYETCLSYDVIETELPNVSTTIVDMSGNGEVLGRLHKYLGPHMQMTMNVGLSHWDEARRSDDINRERSEVFFAPARIQQRMKQWGADEFNNRSSAFIKSAINKSEDWIKLSSFKGLDEIANVFGNVRDGKMSPEEGLAVYL